MQFLGGLRPNACSWLRSFSLFADRLVLLRARGRRLGARDRICGHALLRGLGRGVLCPRCSFALKVASIFRLLLKVAVSVTHQCALSNFCKASCLYSLEARDGGSARLAIPADPTRRTPRPPPRRVTRCPARPAHRWPDAICWFWRWCVRLPYLLSLLAMIKCSICSYQCDN